MEKSFTEIFASQEDYYRWDNYIAQLQEVNLPDKDKDQVRAALNYLRVVLGENFLKRAFIKRHPFPGYYLLNRAPWVWLSLLRFSNILRSFEELPNFDNLIRRIKSPKALNGFVEAHSVLDVAHKFQKTGFDVLLDIKVEVTDRRGNKKLKEPDIKLTEPQSNEEIYIEVTKLGPSRRQEFSRICHNVIWDLLHNAMDCEEGWKVNYQNGAFYLPYSRLLRELKEDELKDLVINLKEFIDDVKTSKEFKEFYKTGIFECAIAPPGQHSLVEDWAKARDIKKEEFILEPTPVPVDGVIKLKSRIKKEVEQLPKDKPGIVVIDFGDLATLRTFPIEIVILELEKRVRLHPQLLFAIILQRWGMGSHVDKSEAYGEHLVFERERSDSIIEKSIVVRNTSSNQPVSESTYKKLMAAAAESV